MNADIPLYLWESFIAVIEETTLQRAAEKLHTTQPTITRHLHQLEESLPLKLFELRGRAKMPTPFAEELYQKINLRLKYLPEDIRESLQNYGESTARTLKIYGSKDLLRRFFSEHSFKGTMKMIEAPEGSLKDLLRENRTDIAISFEVAESPHYVAKKIFRNDWHLVVPKKFTRGNKDLKDWGKNAAKFPLSIFSQQEPIYRNFKNAARIDFEIEDWQTLEERVQAGLSWSVIPRMYVRKNPSYLTKSIVMGQSKASRDIFVYYRKDLQRQPWFKEFLGGLGSFGN